jgi:hypothetical protein
MLFKVSTHARKFFVLALVAGFVGLAVSLSPGAASASSPFSSELHVTKECPAYTGAAGDFCTITSSNLPAIAVGSKVIYERAFDGTHSMALNSNIVLDDGSGNTAFGHVHLDGTTGTGWATFWGGTGTFTGFHATVAVSALGGFDWAWEGTYSFSPPN